MKLGWDEFKTCLNPRHRSRFEKWFERGSPYSDLVVACVKGDFFEVDALIAADPRLASLLSDHTIIPLSPLHLAAAYGHRALAELLMARGAAVNVQDQFLGGPLHEAARYGHADMVALLLDHGADVGAKDYRGETVLHHAGDTDSGTGEVVEILVNAGAELESRCKRRTPLQAAACRGNMDVIRSLVRLGADVNAPAPAERSGSWDENEDYWPLLQPYCECPLYLAVLSGSVELVEFLLDHGAHINALSFGWSALHAAAAKPDRRIVELLLRRGADPFVRADVKSPHGEEHNHPTPMELLAGFGRSRELFRKAER